MVQKSWLGLLCGGLLLVAPVMAWADAGAVSYTHLTLPTIYSV